MIRIITGEIDSGKSTRFLRLYKEEKNGIGLYSRKIRDNEGRVTGYNLILLPVEEEIPFISLKDSIPEEEAGNYYIQGRFAFLKETFKTAERYILSYPATEPVWIDEIGSLELKGLGYGTLLAHLLKSGRDVTLVVRSDLIDSLPELEIYSCILLCS